jgi:hypothetical protein
MTKDERMDKLTQKVKRGIRLSFKKFLAEAIANNDKLVIMRNDKVVLVPAREIETTAKSRTKK